MSDQNATTINDATALAQATLQRLKHAANNVPLAPREHEIGRVLQTGDGIARVAGLPGARSQELLDFGRGIMGIALNLDEHEVGCVLLGDGSKVFAGDTVRRTGQVVQIPVGQDLLGRMIDPLGAPLDAGPDLKIERYDAIERPSPPILARSPVQVPMATGIKSIDAMIPIGRGQRELIISDRSTGKTTIAVDAMLNQRDSGVICIYVAIGQRASAIARVHETLRVAGALDYCVIVAADADSPPGMKYIAPYAGCTVSEYFMNRGHDTLIIYDDLTKHAQTYRQISLLLRRPPGREAYPGDIFFLHSRLLERAVQLDDAHGGGSQTALPIIETQAQNISAYVPTNLISITDGQIYLSPDLFQAGFLPAVDIGLSVSRVGGKTQIKAMKKLAQQMRLSYTQFVELEQFTKFGTTMEAKTLEQLEKGRRVRELLKQDANDPVPLGMQVLLLHLAATDALTEVPVAQIRLFEKRFRALATARLSGLIATLAEGTELTKEDTQSIATLAQGVRDGLGD